MDWLRTGQPRYRSSSPGRVKHFCFSISSRPALGLTSFLFKGYWGLFPRGKAAAAWSWPLTSNYCRGKKKRGSYIHSPIHLHGVVLNWLSTGTTLTLPYGVRSQATSNDVPHPLWNNTFLPLSLIRIQLIKFLSNTRFHRQWEVRIFSLLPGSPTASTRPISLTFILIVCTHALEEQETETVLYLANLQTICRFEDIG
jgi:hypothetical protein